MSERILTNSEKTKFFDNPYKWTKERWKPIALGGLGIALLLAVV